MKIYNIVEVISAEDYHLLVQFNDGSKKIIDIKPFIKEGVSSKLRDINYFNKVQLIDGFITWDNGFDFCPNFLYQYKP